jgi:ferric-dicitrate binding protein FerR (iron transport regulator)
MRSRGRRGPARWPTGSAGERLRCALVAAGLATFGVPLSIAPASAQAGCSITTYSDPPREVLKCADGLSVSAESSTRYRLIERGGRPVGADLTQRGLLVEIPPGRRRPFQILTPHAIASVRGTIYAVDVGASRTSVFVERGAVAVSRRDSTNAVTLGAGDGVDVDTSGGPLRVVRWSRERAANLLARFGR